MLEVLASAVENQCLDKVSISLRWDIVCKGERAKEKSARMAL